MTAEEIETRYDASYKRATEVHDRELMDLEDLFEEHSLTSFEWEEGASKADAAFDTAVDRARSIRARRLNGEKV
jgi:tRNA A37 threonylcarbamoyladenosine biosynthesis protein TsaE